MAKVKVVLLICSICSHEIIEFPAVLVDTTSQAIVDEFHMYCRPEVNPILSEFCVNLTGIRQVGYFLNGVVSRFIF
jgi:inhibitor of KinA sporulation pathway (predicted exonuclease)